MVFPMGSANVVEASDRQGDGGLELGKENYASKGRTLEQLGKKQKNESYLQNRGTSV